MALYQRFNVKDFTIRDYLALERTIMSNERTLLSYSRAGLTLVIAGVTALHFFNSSAGEVGGWIVVMTGMSVMAFGITRFISIKGRLDIASPQHSADETARQVSEAGPSKASD